MHDVKSIISDELLDVVFGNANFGEMSKRDVVKGALLKCAAGYRTGHTAKQIVSELGLVTTNWKLTTNGQRYLFAAYSGGVSI